MRRPYQVLFDTVLTRVDPETAHRVGFAALRLGRPVLPALPALAAFSTRPRRPRPVEKARIPVERARIPVERARIPVEGARIPVEEAPVPVETARIPGAAAESAPSQPQSVPVQRGRVEAMGLSFPGPLGLAAGFDKNAVGIDALAALGFSFVEVGTVTGQPQPGNPRPRLFRLPADRAVVNRMGFNNDGAEVVARRLAARLSGRHRDVVVGVNIGKTKAVPEAEAVADYEKSTRLLAPYADYLVVNVSSPNTPGLRDLQAVDRLEPLLTAVRRQADAVTSRRLPLLVKIAPDLADKDILEVADLALSLGLDGIVATNTTTSREGLRSTPGEVAVTGSGGLSGAPLKQRSLEVLALLRERVGPGLALISVGGIETVEDARARLDAGANLLQAYTAFVYQGAGWPSRLQRALTAPTAERIVR